MYFLSFIYPTHIISFNLSVSQAHFNDYCICTTLFPSLLLSLPLSPSLLPFTSFTRIVFAAKPVCKRYCALISLESWQPASNMCHIVILPHSLTLAELSFHICQNEIRVSFCQPLLSHSPATPLSRSFTHSSAAAAAAAAHNSINCPKLTVRQPFIYLSNPLCRRSLALSLSPSLFVVAQLFYSFVVAVAGAAYSFHVASTISHTQIPFRPINHFTFLTVHTSCSLLPSPSHTLPLSLDVALFAVVVQCDAHF